ncbi:MAG: biotin--[acetyl-CoA-carboxylase] ligase, partial [Alphaproteobacteria bacterium]
AKALAAAGAAPWTIVWAREQASGRGRLGREWASPAGNLYMSIILRPAGLAASIMQLGFATALAVAEGVAACAPDLPTAMLKWPNDVLLGGAKLAGILLESTSGEDASLAWLVVGIGVNVESHPVGAGISATSLKAAGGAVDVETLLAAIVDRQVVWLELWEREGFGPVREAWLCRSANIGTQVVVKTHSGEIAGRFVDLDRSGAMLLDSAEGRRVITSGDVFPVAA